MGDVGGIILALLVIYSLTALAIGVLLAFATGFVPKLKEMPFCLRFGLSSLITFMAIAIYEYQQNSLQIQRVEEVHSHTLLQQLSAFTQLSPQAKLIDQNELTVRNIEPAVPPFYWGEVRLTSFYLAQSEQVYLRPYNLAYEIGSIVEVKGQRCLANADTSIAFQKQPNRSKNSRNYADYRLFSCFLAQATVRIANQQLTLNQPYTQWLKREERDEQHISYQAIPALPAEIVVMKSANHLQLTLNQQPVPVASYNLTLITDSSAQVLALVMKLADENALPVPQCQTAQQVVVRIQPNGQGLLSDFATPNDSLCQNISVAYQLTAKEE